MFNTLGNIVKVFLVAIYIRLSKEDDNLGESESIQNQKALLTKYVEEQGFTLVDIYIDDGYTGTNFDRPAFQRMLKDIEAGKINMVITKDLSRLSRDYIGTGEFIEKWFPAHGVRYIALTDSIDTAIDSANNDIAPFKAILNDMYAKDLSKKIRTALHTMQAEGKWVGGCTPYGYKPDPNDKNHLIVDELEGPVVKRIFKLFLEGNSFNKIRDILNDEEIPTFSVTRNRNFERKGNNGNIVGLWNITTIKKILKNRLYVGDMIQNRRSRLSYKFRKMLNNPESEWIIVENTHEPIVDRKTFNEVQSRLPKQAQRNDKKELFLLDGLIKCADCGHNIGIKARDKKTGKAYTVCNYYRRYRKKYNICTAHGTDYDKFEKNILDIIKQTFLQIDNSRIEYLINDKLKNSASFNELYNEITKLKNEIETLKISIDNMYIDKLQGKITDEMYNRINGKIFKEIEKKEKLLEEKNNYLETTKTDEESAKNLNVIIDEFLNIKNPNRDLILKLINNISMHEDGNVDIHFNFKELNFIYNSYSA